MSLSSLLTTCIAWFDEHSGELMLYLHIVLAALFPIYTGAHASLSRPSSAAKAEHSDEDEEEEAVQVMEGLSASDAIVFPVTAGLVLATLYWLIKRYGADIINVILAWYFAGTSVFSVAKLFSDGTEFCTSYIFPKYFVVDGELCEVKGNEVVSFKGNTIDRSSPLPGFLGRLPLPESLLWSTRSALKQKYTLEAYIKALLDVKTDFTVIDIAGLIVGISAVAYNSFVAKPWWLTNTQGFAVSYFAIQLISPTSFNIGSLVLCGLFFYDIWAVFYTPLMVTVATKLDQPIKLLFPRPDADLAKKAYSMLGLGDIVLPGLMVGLALRFDLHMHYSRQKGGTGSTLKAAAAHDVNVDVDVSKAAHAKTIDGDISKNPQTKPATDTAKAVYTPATGHWGSRSWTRSLPKASLPMILQNAAFPKRYFAASITGYIAGMAITLAVMSVFQHAQPALLYLVPSVLISLWGTAAYRGEVREMWMYSEELSGEALAESAKDINTKIEQSDGAKTWSETIKHALFGHDTSQSSSNEADDKDFSAGKKKQEEEELVTSAASEPDTVFSMTVRCRSHVARKADTTSQSLDSISKHKQ